MFFQDRKYQNRYAKEVRPVVLNRHSNIAIIAIDDNIFVWNSVNQTVRSA